MKQIQVPSWIESIFAIFRLEWRQMMQARLTHIFLAAFPLALAALVFGAADFFSSNEASLRLLITFLPWVALVLVPALAMRFWADANSDRSLELGLAFPLSTSALVAGKFIAGSSVLLIALGCTAAFPISVIYLGEPDFGALVAVYVAAGLYLMTCFAICLLASALAREQVTAFILGVFFLLMLTLAGWDLFGNFLETWLPGSARDVLMHISPKVWLGRIAHGNLQLSVLLKFAVMIGLCLAATTHVVEQRRAALSTINSAIRFAGVIPGMLVACVLISKGADRITIAADLTDEKEFSLPRTYEEILKSVPEGTEVKVYWSESEGSVPTSISSHARRVVERLRLIARRSSGNLSVHVIDPKPDSNKELQALQNGLRRVPMTSGDFFYLGAIATAGERIGRIGYFDFRRQQLLDYDIAVLLSELGRKATRRIGILSPLIAPSHLDTGRPGLSILEDLQKAFDLAIIPHFSDKLPSDLDALLVIDATILKPEILYEIDQFVMRGGGLITLIDPQLRSNAASNLVNPTPTEELNDISDLLLRYGIRYLGKEVIGDGSYAAQVMNNRQQQSSYPFWLRLPRGVLSNSHPVTADLNELLIAEPGALEILPSSGGQKLIETSSDAGSLPRALFKNAAPELLATQFQQEGGQKPIAATLFAPIASAFQSRTEGPHLKTSNGPVPIFVVADIDWIFDDFAVQKLVADNQETITRPLNDNHALLTNMIEFAAGDRSLISIRSRGQLNRPFTRVEKMFRDAQARYRDQETTLAERISRVEAEIARIPAAAGVKSIDELPVSIKTRIADFRTRLLPLRRELRQIRLSMREKIEQLRMQLTVFNLLMGPFLALLLAVLARMTRMRWQLR